MSSFRGECPRLLVGDEPLIWDLLPAEQQPQWRDHSAYPATRHSLLRAAPLALHTEVTELREGLAAVARGEARLLQMGDCAESLAEQTSEQVAGKVSALNELGDLLSARTGQEVVRVGRIGGQFAKPRSSTTERYADVELQAFRGHMVNSEEPSPKARQHDPRRMLLAYEAGVRVFDHLRQVRQQRTATGAHRSMLGPWASHEALIIDYEGPLIRTAPGGGEYLASTHLPWVGDRTRSPDSTHVEMLAAVQNPVACKIGPTARPEDVVRLCERLDPERSLGRLTLILRFGRAHVTQVMPAIVDAVRNAGHPVVWMTDPMHGNTVLTARGIKTRHLQVITEEATEFLRVLERRGLHAGGLHLETAANDVTECLGVNLLNEDALARRYETLCDPRLNPEQAHELVSLLFRQ